MILFLDDWKKFPTATYDDTTTNTTFLRLVETYYRMGIKNHLFPLALYQPALKGVDPFSPDLTPEQIGMISFEAKFNPWYYLREVSKVPVPGGTATRFRSTRANIAMYWSFLNHFDYANIQPRQCGKSVGADVLNNWLIHLAAFNTNIQLYTHSRQLRAENIKRLKAIRDTLPEFLNFFDPRVDADNTEILTCKALENKYLTAVAQKDKDQAHNLGRGLTAPVIQTDEGPFCPNIKISYPVMMGSTRAARELAEENGTFYGNIITTTAGDLLTESGRYMYKLIHEGMPWDERILDCANRMDALAFIKENSRNKEVVMVNGTFSALQVGKSMEWLKSSIMDAKGSPEDARRDYLNEWTTDTKGSPLSATVHEALRTSIREKMFTDANKYNFLMFWYINRFDIDTIMDQTYTTLTVDTANLAGSDANALVISDMRTMEVLAVSAVSSGSLQDYGHWLADLLIAYPKTTLVIEHKSSATGILDTVTARLLAAGIDPFKRIFNRIVNEPERYQAQYAELTQGMGLSDPTYATRHKDKFGFMTTGKSRDVLYNQVLFRATQSCAHLVRDQQLVNQIRQLEKRNGRIDHPEGGHDDLVIAWLLGHWFTTFGRNLSFYGIPRGYAQSMVTENGALISKEDAAQIAKHNSLMARIELLRKQLALETNDILRSAVELKIHGLLSQIEDSQARGRITDEIIQEMQDARKRKTNLKDAVARHQNKTMSWY